MKICVAQLRPVKGDIEGNISKHKRLIDLALSTGADTIVFPELSITGYEPTLAQEMATTPDDSRLDTFQEISDTKQITMGIGVPTRADAGNQISMLIFQPNKAKQLYSKKYLHADEEPFFVSGQNESVLLGDTNIGLAICYELSVPEHAENAFQNGAGVYLTSVAKTAKGVESGNIRLAEIAKKYGMPVLMSNCLGFLDGVECVGQSAVWNSKGELLGQLDSTHEGILTFDTETEELVEKTIKTSTSSVTQL